MCHLKALKHNPTNKIIFMSLKKIKQLWEENLWYEKNILAKCFSVWLFFDTQSEKNWNEIQKFFEPNNKEEELAAYWKVSFITFINLSVFSKEAPAQQRKQSPHYHCRAFTAWRLRWIAKACLWFSCFNHAARF